MPILSAMRLDGVDTLPGAGLFLPLEERARDEDITVEYIARPTMFALWQKPLEPVAPPTFAGLPSQAVIEREPAVIDRLRDVLRQQDGVRLAYLFGSRARQQERADSDFDIAVLLDDAAAAADRGRTLRELAAALGRVVAATLVDLVVLNDAPSLLRHRVLRDGILLVARTPEDRVRFVRRTLRDYQDQQIRRECATRARIHRLTREGNDGRSGDLLEKARGAARLLAQAARVP